MDTSKNKSILKNILNYIASIISWTVFTLLMICLIFLLYYFICTKLLAKKGEKFEPFFSLYTIASPSMTPNIKVYDVIVNLKVKDPNDIKIGDVITFISESPECLGIKVTHRVVGIEKDADGKISYQTKGDANLIADSALAPYENVIGKVSFKIPMLGRIQFFLSTKVGWLLLIFLPAFCILLNSLLDAIKKYVNFDKYADKRWYKILHKPLLTGRKVKLLPEPKEIEPNISSIELPKEKESVEDTELTNKKDTDIVGDDTTCFDLPVLNDEIIKNNDDAIKNDVTQIDLPVLKK